MLGCVDGGSQLVVVLALVAAGLALLAAIACIVTTAWLVRRERRGHLAPAPRVSPQPPLHQPTVVHVLQPQQPVVYVQQHPGPVAHVGWMPPAPPVQSAPPHAPIRLQRPWPGVADALGQHLRVEADPVERMRVAIDLGGMGGARPARLLLDAVRDGSISPAAGAEAISRTGFDGGVIAGMALAEADPRVRSLARLVLDGAHAEPVS